MINEFDIKARDWDSNPLHIERSKAIAEVLKNSIPLRKNMKALEFGAGTGLLSFLLRDALSEITLMDSSLEMIEVIKGKISGQGILTMKPVMLDLEHEDYVRIFDIIYNQMVLHHVGNIDVVLHKFHKMLTQGGYLAIADLYAEDGTFHGEGFTGHNGFDVHELAIRIKDAGFRNIKHKPCFIIRKTTDSGYIKEYPVFLITALK